jgi:tetratricopeptide (TPR) repeat protein
MDRNKGGKKVFATAGLPIVLTFSVLAISARQPATAADNGTAGPSTSLAQTSTSFGLGSTWASDYNRMLRESIESTTAAINKDPENVRAYMRRADAYEHLRQTPQAINDYSKVIKIDPQNSDAYEKRGAAYRYSMEQCEQAIVDYNMAASLDPYNAKTFWHRGDALNKLGRHEEAIKDFTRAIDLNPKEADAYFSRAETYRELGRNDLAERDSFRWKLLERARGDIERCSAAIGADPDNVGLYYLRADAFSRRNQFNGALEDLTQVINLKANSAEAYFLRGRTWMELRNPTNAIADYSSAIKLDPNGVQARRWKLSMLDDGHKGTVYIARGKALIEQCHRNYNTAFVGRQGELRSNFAMAAQGMRMFNSGTRGYQSASGLQAMSLHGLKQTEKAEDEYRKAIQDYSTAISLDNKDAEPYEQRARAYEELRQYHDAVRDYDTAITMGTSSPCTGRAILFTRQADCYEKLHQYQRAISDYSTVIEEMTRVVAQAERSNNLSSEAQDLKKEIDSLTVSILGDAYAKRARLYQQLGQQRNAQADFSEVCRLDPSKAAVEASLCRREISPKRKWF